MARRVFFSFHFDNDIWRTNIIRQSNVVNGVDRVGFYDHSEYEEAVRKGDKAKIRRMIDENLKGTSVTIVLIGSETANRPWVQYEIEKSIEQGNGLLGIHIHMLKDQYQRTSLRGPKPTVPYGTSFPYYDWDGDFDRLKREIEAAGKRSDALRV
jgi:MTH538 TIR-like domain (DUF1863)